MSIIYPLLVFYVMPKIVTKRMQFVFWVLILWKKKVSRSKPRPSSSFKSAWKSRSPQSLVLFFCCFSLFFARFFVCISMSLIHPFHCLEFHQPGLTCLYTQWHTVSKVSPHTIFLRFSRQDCHCWFVSVEQEPHSTVIYLHCFVSHSPSSARLSAL